MGNVGGGCYAFVIDTGVLETTGDLILNQEWSRSWVNGESAFTDGNGHGTHVAGTIAALANNLGVVGVAPGAEIVSLKVFDSFGSGATFGRIIDAVNYATSVINQNGLNKNKCVINMSLGGGFSSGLDQAVRNAADQGIKFAIAAGNTGSDADFWSPASTGDHPNVYTVSAVDNQYRMASWSNWDDVTGGDDVDIAAPGVQVLSYYQGGTLRRLSGTSMAAPHVAGLLLVGNGKLTEGDMVQANASGHSDPFALVAANSAPELTGEQATLAKGKEDTPYIIQEADLLEGFSDRDGDKLQVEDLKSSAGSLKNNNNGNWTYTPKTNDNGTIKLNYTVGDGNGNSIEASNRFELEAVNDKPIVSAPVDLGAIDEDGSIRITQEKLLKNSFDIEGEKLIITDLRISKGNGKLSDNTDGSWIFSPSKDWNGEVELTYAVTDSKSDDSQRINDKVFVRGNSLYTVVEGKSWSEAEKNSNKLGGHLVTINNQEEADFLSQKIYKNPAKEHLNSHFFIGLNDEKVEGRYEWSSGDVFNFKNFAESPAFDINSPHNKENDYFIIYSGKDGKNDWINVDNNSSFWDSHGINSFGITESNFLRRGDSAYVIVEGPTWEEAEENARKLGGNLVTINDKFENQWIVDNYYGEGKISEEIEIKSVWIGYNDLKAEGQWEWISGEKTIYTNWAPGEPDGTSSNKAGEQYAEFLLFDSFNRDPGMWGDHHNDKNINRYGLAEIKLDSDFGIKTSASLSVKAVNDAPELTGDKAKLDPGQEDTLYTIKTSDLLQGWTDVEGDTLSIKNLVVSTGKIVDVGDGTWILHTPQHFNGKVELSYSVADEHGAAVHTRHSIEIKNVNDAPESKPIGFVVETDEVDTATVSLAQLLSGSFDIDGDQLSVRNVQTSNGILASENDDGGWLFQTNGENGEFKLLFDVTDGVLTTKAELLSR